VKRTVRAVLIIAAASLTGCGGAGPDYPLAPARGTVRLDGQPLAGVVIEFVPQQGTKGIGATAMSGADGTYALENKHGGKGAAPGEYRVTVQRPQTRGPGAVADPEKAKAAAGPPVPSVYGNHDATPLRVTVPPKGGTFDLDLKSDAKAG
jgi:hypothetical protein